MKKIIYLLFMFALALLIVSGSYAQAPNPNTPDDQLKKDEAELRIKELQNTVADLENRLRTLDGDVTTMQRDLETARQQLKDCQDSYYSMLGVTNADVENFRQQIGAIEGRIRTMQRLSDDELSNRQDEVKTLENDLNALRSNKIAALPEFYNKIISLASDIRGLYRERKIKSYTVGTWQQDRDCLWNIAGKMEIYGDPFQWPKIWQANTDQIRNPDIIYPGQVLQIPPAGPMSDEEMKAQRRYFRTRRAALDAPKVNNKPVSTDKTMNTD